MSRYFLSLLYFFMLSAMIFVPEPAHNEPDCEVEKMPWNKVEEFRRKFNTGYVIGVMKMLSAHLEEKSRSTCWLDIKTHYKQTVPG